MFASHRLVLVLSLALLIALDKLLAFALQRARMPVVLGAAAA